MTAGQIYKTSSQESNLGLCRLLAETVRYFTISLKLPKLFPRHRAHGWRLTAPETGTQEISNHCYNSGQFQAAYFNLWLQFMWGTKIEANVSHLEH